MRSLGYTVAMSPCPYLLSTLASILLAPELVQDAKPESAPAQDGSPWSDARLSREVTPVLDLHCIDCHSSPEPEGGLNFEKLVDPATAFEAPKLWHRVHEVLNAGSMPPKAIKTRPSQNEVAGVLRWIDDAIEAGRLPKPHHPSGRTTMRRLNRLEYQHAVFDLLGVDYPTTERLPADGVAHGFDVIGDVLSMPPVLFEKYFEAAEQVAFEALPEPGLDNFEVQQFEPSDFSLSMPEFLRERIPLIWMYTNGTASVQARAQRNGDYSLRVEALATQAGPDIAKLRVRVDQQEIGTFEVSGTGEEPSVFEMSVRLEAGEHEVALSFVNDYYDPDNPNPDQRDRNLGLLSMDLFGPMDKPMLTDFQVQFMGEEGIEKDAAAVVAEVAELLWRGPVEAQSVQDLLGIAGEEATDLERIRGALTALLTSPRFLFRVENQPAGDERPLEGHEMATRLAAFLWSSVPDALLLEMGWTGELEMPAVLEAQVERMLNDSRASRLSESFAAQWLQLRRLEETIPDPQRFPNFDDQLRTAMGLESALFFESVLRENRPVSELLHADYTFVNERLAQHYGIAGVHGDHMRRVAIPARLKDQRSGILGHAAVLTATSMPTRTSPVKRGKWVLEALLATPPPPPPPGVDSLDEDLQSVSAATIRERMEQHRKDSACSGCHATMDGLGLALERFDAIGAWRERDGNFPIDDSAELPGGESFQGPAGLRDSLSKDRAFLRGLLHHLTTFALGRGLAPRDEEHIEATLKQLPSDPSLREVIHAITRMKAFNTRFGERENS